MSRAAQLSVPMIVAFDDADGEGIVFFGNYFRLAHRALEKYLPQLGIPWRTWFAHEVWGVPLRKVECEYFKPLTPGQEFESRVQITAMTNSTVTFMQEFWSDGNSTAKIVTTHVFVDRKTRRKMDIPAELRSILETQLLP